MTTRKEIDWRATIPVLSSDRVAYLAFKALFDPRTVTPAEVQELAAAVVAHLNGGQETRPH